MDSRAKQRLTGAIILVALFVLLVPELLTGPRSNTPATDAPADDGLRRYTIDLDAPGASVQPTPAPASQPAVALPAPPPQATPQPVAQAAAAPKPVTPSAATPAPRTETPAPRTETPVPRAETPPPRTETPPPRAVTAPPAATSGAFAVQLGTFKERDNAVGLVRDMTSKGFNAFVAPITIDGRELYRVRVGPTRDRAAAEALAAQLRRIGQKDSSIVPIS